MKEDQEYEQDEDEEDDDDDDDNEEEEGEGEDDDEKEEDMKEDMGGASVAIDLCVVCLARPRNASTWWHRTSSLLPWICLKVESWKNETSYVPHKKQTSHEKFCLVTVNCYLSKYTQT